MPPYYITTPIYYVNDQPHIGHIYTTTVADIIARYHRMTGDDTFFLTGTDEHAAKVVDAAAERGLTAQEWADENAAAFETTFAKLDMSHDDFIRTSQDRHKRKVEQYVRMLIDSGDVYLGEYEGWYDAGEEEYVPEKRAAEHEYKSPISGRALVRRSEKNYFFRLSAYRNELLTLLEQGGEVDGCTFKVEPQARRNEIIARIKEAEDVPISRKGRTDWGIAVPGDPDHTIYVWIDALFNYLTTVDTDERRHYWQGGAVHLIAKDILWFHAAIWPAVLLALRKCAGYEWVNLPRVVYAHSFWISEGQKMSKSLGNFIDLEKIDHYVETFGLDALRYFLAVRGPMGTTDSDFSEHAFIETYNSDLANTFGNCVSRVTKMIGKYFDGVLPRAVDLPWPVVKYKTYEIDVPDEIIASGQAEHTSEGVMELNLQRLTSDLRETSSERLLHLQLSDAQESAMSIVREVDGYIDKTQPFKLVKDETKLPEVGTILYNCIEALRIASVLLWPFIPNACEAFWQRMGLDYAAQMRANDEHDNKFSEWTRWGQFKPGTPIEKGASLFPRYQPPKT
ncbi:MAG: methionine--tRNA ligase [Phycisphaerales bacterium]|nr:methionine--tRNA ligase [Phycisphaerales bacterium]